MSSLSEQGFEDVQLAAGTKALRRQAVKARLRAALPSTDLNRQARLEMMLRSLDRGTGTKAPGVVRTGVPEDRIVLQKEFDLLVAGTSRRTSLFLWFLYNTGCRVAEMCSARPDRCEDLGDMVRLTITGKGNKERKVDVEKSLFGAHDAPLFRAPDYYRVTCESVGVDLENVAQGARGLAGHSA